MYRGVTSRLAGIWPEKPEAQGNQWQENMVGVAGFEPATPASRTLGLIHMYLIFRLFSFLKIGDLLASFTVYRWFFGGWEGVTEVERDQHNDADPIVLHWNAATSEWTMIPWDAWMHFRALRGDFRALSGLKSGDHYFVVCIVDSDGTLYNILPHRYRLDADGHITDHHFDDLDGSERAFVSKWQVDQDAPQGADADKFDELRGRIWRGNLPPTDAARALIRNLPGFPATDTNRPVLSFLREFGIAPSARPSTAIH
ncbi:MAG: hypothetical protein WBH00_16590 [Xanthobacteraceae bacterium]